MGRRHAPGLARERSPARRRAPRGDRASRRAGLLPDGAGDLRSAARVGAARRYRERVPNPRLADVGGASSSGSISAPASPLRAGLARAAIITTISSATAAARSRHSRTATLERALDRVEADSGYAVAGARRRAARRLRRLSLSPRQGVARRGCRQVCEQVDDRRGADDRGARRQRRDQVGDRDARSRSTRARTARRARGRAYGLAVSRSAAPAARRSGRAGAARRRPASLRPRRSRAGRRKTVPSSATGTPRAAATCGVDRREEQRPGDHEPGRPTRRRRSTAASRAWLVPRLKIDPNSVRAAIDPVATAAAAVEEVEEEDAEPEHPDEDDADRDVVEARAWSPSAAKRSARRIVAAKRPRRRSIPTAPRRARP